MEVNRKKPLTFTNRTNYFVPDKDRVKVTVSSPSSYCSRQSKIESYETRLYYQFKYCESVNGQTFFYTLTYNDNALPKSYGFDCFDYEDLRDLLTGGFRKQLLRKYGSVFKYFIGAELGDGKGKRGMHNNPHYHILFFVEPDPKAKFPYIKILPEDFRHLVRLYWQGFDENKTGFQDYNTAKYGIAREGENIGLVSDFRACCYVSKYVTKDSKLLIAERVVENKIKYKVQKDIEYKDDTYRDFFYEVIYPLFNTPLNAIRSEWSRSDVELVQYLLPDHFAGNFYPPATLDGVSYAHIVIRILDKYSLHQAFSDFLSERVCEATRKDLNNWRNRYTNKVRISQGVGKYGLDFISDKMNPTILVPDKKIGFKNRPIGLYYYRKLFCDIVKDKNGSPLYVLNELGIKYKQYKLKSQLHKIEVDASSNLDLIINDLSLYNQMLSSDVNTDVNLSHSEFIRSLGICEKSISRTSLIQRYAEFKSIYEYRYFELKDFEFPEIRPLDDYGRFLKPSFFSVSRNDLRLQVFLEDSPSNYLSYENHPYFLSCLGIFRVLDLCTDYLFVKNDDEAQKTAEELARIKRFHSKQKLEQFYKPFSL